MAVFELVIAMLLGGALLAAWSGRIGVPYPALLSLAGAIAAIVPGTPEVVIEPELALALFVAPTLLDAAFDASPRDLRDNWLPVGLLAVVVVGLTVAVVAVTVRLIAPDLPWAAAIALGAVVAPPDASAAAAVLRQLRLPHRLLVILEEESLLNDATALLIYRVAVGAAAGGAAFGWHLLPELLLTAGGGAVLGWALARIWLLFPMHRAEIPIAVLVQFIGAFAVWMLADRLGVSAIITMVVYAMVIARHAPARSDARHRIASYAVWEVAVFVLNVLAFVLIGLQLKAILGRLDGAVAPYAWTAGAVLLAVILVRFAWVMSYNAVLRWKIGRFGPGPGRVLMRPTVQGGIVVSWCGMRGIVTLATALALPEAFPGRDLIVFCAFWVVLGTLVVQGATLRPLLRRLTLPEDRTVEEEVRLARAETARAALGHIDGHASRAAAGGLRSVYARRGGEVEPAGEALVEMHQTAVAIQRRRLMTLRAVGEIGDDAFHVLEEEIDILELNADPRVLGVDPSGERA
ncbi:cation:proton antiporter [Falsiroseomonas sp. HW251]|uniref:cation:proton antiporter n=1 Tax=Falsiroseomonas sp. HW251 TaxID=3390998 RepID=UPI003D31E060